MSPAVIAFIKGIGIVAIVAILTYLGNAANLTSILNPGTATIVAGLAVWLEGIVQGKTGNALFGAVSIQK